MFRHHKNLILIDDVDINKILISDKVSSGENNYEYFFYYKDDNLKLSHFL